MVGIKRVLLPTDFSDVARHAAPFARSLVERYDATLHVIHVSEPVFTGLPASEIGVGVVALPVDEASTRSQLTAFVDACFASLPTPPVTALLSGSAPVAITDYARENAIDLIVVGTHARGLMNRILLGSVSKSVVEHAHCAVLMVPLRAAMSEG